MTQVVLMIVVVIGNNSLCIDDTILTSICLYLYGSLMLIIDFLIINYIL